MDDLDFIMAVEMGAPLTEEEVVAGMQRLIDSGLVWNLQGFWGRVAKSMIEEGECHAKRP
jgi:hypothetical protein